MSAKNPTPDDLRTIARNMEAETPGNSRVEVLRNAADRMETLEAALGDAVKTLQHLDNLTMICPACGVMNGHSQKCYVAQSLAAGYEALKGGAE